MTAGTAFDADVLIYAAADGHPLGRHVAALLEREAAGGGAIGSVLLLTEVLAKPLRADPDSLEVAALLGVLSRLELRSLDEATAEIALALAVTYGLRAADAAHLATAVSAGAERFVTNNRKDFTPAIAEIAITYPDEIDALLTQSDGNGTDLE